jgi:hypothetical protein
MELLKDLGIAGFLFFFLKGLLWLVLFVLVYFGLINKKKVRRIKEKMNFWKRKKDT